MHDVQNKEQENWKQGVVQAFLVKCYLKWTLATRLCIVLAFFSCLLYANTLRNDYVMDDVMMIVENNYVHMGVAGIPLLFKTSHMKGFHASERTEDYRPLSLVMFAIEYQFFGLNPVTGHLISVLVFAACVVVLFQFINRLCNGEKIVVAFVASLLFAVHPVHTEVVANIKSRDELLCFFFAFLSLCMFIDYAKEGKLYKLFFGALCLFLSVLSKETSVTFVALVPVIFFFYQNENKRRSVYITISTLAVVFLFFVIWTGVISSNDPAGVKLVNNLLANSNNASTYLAADIHMFGRYITLLLVPYPLNNNYDFRLFASAGFGTWAVWASLLSYLLLALTGIFRLLKYKKDLWAFGILLYLITLSLFSNFPFLLAQPMSERYVFFASAGFCLLFALAFERWVTGMPANKIAVLKSTKAIVVLLPVLLCYSVITVARNMDWKSNLSLTLADVPKSPDDANLQYRAGLELQVKYNSETDTAIQRKLNEESIGHFLKSLAIRPDYTESHSDLGVAYFRENNYDSAEFHFKRVLELNPRHFNSSTNLATLYFKKQQFRDAITYYRRAVQIDPVADLEWYNMGIAYARLLQYDSAIMCSKMVIAIAPQYDNYKSYGNAAILYKLTGQMDSAIKYEQLTKQYYPGFHL